MLRSVDSYFIIGEDKGTIGKVWEQWWEPKGGSYEYERIADLGEIDGDETVPIISANIGGRIRHQRL